MHVLEYVFRDSLNYVIHSTIRLCEGVRETNRSVDLAACGAASGGGNNQRNTFQEY